MQNPKPRPARKITRAFILGWFWAFCAITGGFEMLLKTPAPAALLILSGLIALPPANNFVAKKFRIALSGSMRAALIFLLLVAAGALTPNSQLGMANSSAAPHNNPQQSNP